MGPASPTTGNVVAFNANCWKSFKYVKMTDADIMVGHEVGLSTKEESASAQDNMGGHGLERLDHPR